MRPSSKLALACVVGIYLTLLVAATGSPVDEIVSSFAAPAPESDIQPGPWDYETDLGGFGFLPDGQLTADQYDVEQDATCTLSYPDGTEVTYRVQSGEDFQQCLYIAHDDGLISNETARTLGAADRGIDLGVVNETKGGEAA